MDSLQQALEALSHHGEVPLHVTLVFSAVLLAMVVTLALEEKLHAKKSLITGVFAVISLFLGGLYDVLPLGPEFNVFGEELALPVYIPAVDWGVIAIIFGSSLFVDVTARSNLFTYVAIRLTKLSRGDPLLLLLAYGVMTVVFSAVLNNVTAMIIVGSLTAVSLKKLGQGDKLTGFLLIEGLLTNVGGLLTLISSVPNIIVGHTAGIHFFHFFVVASPYVVVATAATLWLGARVYRIRRLGSEAERRAAQQEVEAFDENDGVESVLWFRLSGVLLVLFIVAIATASVLPVIGPRPGASEGLGMGFVAVAFGVVALLRYRSSVDQFYRAIDWDLLLFFVYLFIVINVMEHAKVLELMGVGLRALVGLGDLAGAAAILVCSAALSAVTDNIPLAAMLAKILSGMGTSGDSPLWWSVIFGANLGGNLTPIGSASTVVAVTIMHKQQVPMSFLRFVKSAFIFAVLQLLLAVAYVLWVVPLFA